MKKLLALVIIFLAVLFAVRGWWNSQISAVSSDKNEKTIIIAKGKSVSEIAEQLKEEGLIKSNFAFRLYTRQTGASTKIAAGTFKISPAMTIPEIVDILKGKPAEIWVTLIEGWRVEEMAEKLSSELGISSDEFLKLAEEGYMFPDSYLYAPDTSAVTVAKRLRDTFDSRYTEELKEKIKKQGLSEDEGVILASIVEREARSDKARTEVASILLKRLKVDMGLNADATLQYILGYQEDEKSWWKRHLTSEDKKEDSPFNTYLYRGLPPKPICNPGLSSLEAVANADASTPYLYYYHDSKGNSHYGKTLEEHLENVANNP